MRGIAGIVRFNNTSVSSKEIEHLIQSMAICPLDRITTWREGSAGLAHLIKFIQPEDRFESQPLRSADGNLVLVTDAMLENRNELGALLGFTNDEYSILPDSFLLLRAYEKWGDDCLRYLDGQFAFAIWNVRESKLFCAVDQFARRPLYYFRRRGVFAFASTLRGLLSLPGISSQLEEGVLADFLTYTRTEPRHRTLYADIACLPAAHRLSAHLGGDDTCRYWEPDVARTIRFNTDQDYTDAFSSELEAAVAAGLRVVGKIGIQVSGGLDSSAVTAIAGNMLAQQGKRLQAVHIVPASGDPYRGHLLEHDETRYVRMLQQRAPHIDFHFIPQEVGRVSLSHCTTLIEQTCTPTQGVVFENWIRPADRYGLDRMLTGLGGNFIASIEHGGSCYLAQLAITLRWYRLFVELRGQRRVYGSRVRDVLRRQVLAPAFPFRPRPSGRADILPFLNPDFVRRISLLDRIRASDTTTFGWQNFSPRAMAKANMLNVMAQHVGVSGSVINADVLNDHYHPFFSRRLNEFCMAVPPSAQIREGWDRRLLRSAMRGYLPEAVAQRTTRGFPLPGSWRQALSLRDELATAVAQMQGCGEVEKYLNLDRIRTLLSVPGYLEEGRLGAFQFVTLFNTGWFLKHRKRSPL